MGVDALFQIIDIFMKETNQRILKITDMVVDDGGATTTKFMVSVVKEDPRDSVVPQLKKQRVQQNKSGICVLSSDENNVPHMWKQEFDESLFEYQVPFGFVIMQCFASIYMPILNAPLLTILMGYTLFGRGLKRNKTDHGGRFFIIGQRHSCQSNRTMSAYQQKLHDTKTSDQ